MSIKQNGGVFGRNPTFNNVTIDGDLIINDEIFTGLDFQGSWDASTNSPTLTSSVGTQGEFYIVSVAGTTNLNGVTNWGVGDWAMFSGTVWQRIEGGADGNFVNLTASGSLVVDTSTLVVDNTNNRVGIGTLSPYAILDVNSNVARTSAVTTYTEFQSSKDADDFRFGLLTGIKGGATSADRSASIDSATYRISTDAFSGGHDLNLQSLGGNVNIPNGNLVIGTSGNGIDFSATGTGTGTSTSELFADYEEGVWTPTITGSTTAGTGTYTSQSGSYTKIGRQVTVYGRVGQSNNTGTGNIRIAGLPYGLSGDYAVGSIMAGNLSLTASNYPVIFMAGSGATYININQLPTGGGVDAVVPMDTSCDLVFSITYFV